MTSHSRFSEAGRTDVLPSLVRRNNDEKQEDELPEVEHDQEDLRSVSGFPDEARDLAARSRCVSRTSAAVDLELRDRQQQQHLYLSVVSRSGIPV